MAVSVARPLSVRVPARFGVALDPFVETGGLEFFEPGAESRKLIGRQFGHRFFDVFKARHAAAP
jgi:hypothetical protein